MDRPPTKTQILISSGLILKLALAQSFTHGFTTQQFIWQNGYQLPLFLMVPVEDHRRGIGSILQQQHLLARVTVELQQHCLT